MSPARPLAATAFSALLLTGCASLSPRCDAGMTARILDTLYFGTARTDGVVTAQQWQAFVDASITPRFPEGLTSWRADGQWRDADGAVTREASYVLQVVHDGSPARDAALRATGEDYRAQFAQESVMRVRSRVCVLFQ